MNAALLQPVPRITFYVENALRSGSSAGNIPASAWPLCMPHNPVILLVDDDEDSVVLLQNALGRADVGHRQVVARDGKEAIDYLSGSGTYAERKKFPWPALVLLDLKMPGVDGFGVLEWVRRLKKANALAIVVMTASNNDSDRERALALGAAGYYVKPASFTDLVRIAREIRECWLAAAKV